MADPITLFNYYRRYKWRSADFQKLQDNLLAESDALASGAYGAAVLEGLEVTPATGLQVAVAIGVAAGPTGTMMANTEELLLSVTAPTGSFAAKSLIVIRPSVVQQTYITKPTSPFESVPLEFVRGIELAFIEGTASATPDYPAKAATDVILAGIKLSPGQSTITTYDLDFNVRENLGVNSDHIGKRVNSEDTRLKPYRSTYKVLGIKPSQTSGSQVKLFSFPGKTTPSIFPKTSGGLYNDTDTFLDFVTGAITGGDQVSADFTPTIPTGSNSIVATVFLATADTLSVQYGTQGTFQQCVDAIANQDTSGAAGSIYATQTDYKVCYVIITSVSGSVSDIRIVDARALGGGGGSGSTATTVLVRFTKIGHLSPEDVFEGGHVQTTNQDLDAIVISMFDSGTSGSTTVKAKQYRAGVLINSATASLASSSGNPASATCALSGTLNLLIGDYVEYDLVSTALGSPQDISVEYYEIIPGSTPNTNQFAAVFPFIIGSPTQVLAGEATHSSFSSAQSAAVSGDCVHYLKGTFSESPTITKQLKITGSGRGTVLSGSITFDTGSDYSTMKDLKTTQDITLNASVSGCIVKDVFLASGKTFVDNSTGSLVEGIQET